MLIQAHGMVVVIVIVFGIVMVIFVAIAPGTNTRARTPHHITGGARGCAAEAWGRWTQWLRL